MTHQEVEILIDAYYNDYQKQWEQTRWLGFISAVSNGAKLKSPKDLIRFNWEDEEYKDTRTQEEIEQSKLELIEAMNKSKEVFKGKRNG